MPKRSMRSKRTKRRAPRRGRKAPKRKSVFNDAGQKANIKETVEFIDISPNLNYNYVFNLAQFPRASTVAPNFKFYKATSVEWTFTPLYNTFQDDLAGNAITVPYFYTTMNRTQDKSGLIVDDYQSMGAKPKKLNGKTVIRYRPNWCSGGLSAYYFNNNGTMAPLQYTYSQTPQLGLQTQYGWLASPHEVTDRENGETSQMDIIAPADGTLEPPGSLLPPLTGMNPVYTNRVVYNGHSVLIDQEIPTGTLQAVAKVTCTVTWAFKGPQCTYRNPGKTAGPKPSSTTDLS